MSKRQHSHRLLKALAALFVLTLIAYGVLAILYGAEQNTFRLPETVALPRAGRSAW